MSDKEAKDILMNHICACPYGTSPTDCSDDKCRFGIAVRTLCEEAENDIR